MASMSRLRTHVPREHTAQSSTNTLSELIRNFSRSLVFKPAEQHKPPPGWTFHHLAAAQKGRPPEPASNDELPEGASITEAPDEGYFHHAEYRITTNVDITSHSEAREAIVEHVTQKDNIDEFLETIAINTSGPEANETEPTLYYVYVDHLNRTVTDGKLKNGDSYDLHPLSIANPTYVSWIELVTRSPKNHFLLPSADPEKYSCLGRKIAQQVIWDHQNCHITRIDIENAFSMGECASLLSALQKKRVTDKECQKIISVVLNRFLIAQPLKQPILEPSFIAGNAEGEHGRITTVCVLIAVFIWHVPMLSIPYSYFRRLRSLASRADKGVSLSHLWRTLVKGLLKEWAELNIVLALILAANISFLALPGTSENPNDSGYQPSVLADVSRGAGLVSMFTTLGGLLTGLSLTWLHQPMQGTGSLDACRYILGPSYNQSQDLEGQSNIKGSFLRLAWMATYLGMPLVLLSWSVLAFSISAITWTFLFSTFATRVTVVVLCAMVLITPFITLIVFWRPIVAKDGLFAKMVRGDVDYPESP